MLTFDIAFSTEVTRIPLNESLGLSYCAEQISNPFLGVSCLTPASFLPTLLLGNVAQCGIRVFGHYQTMLDWKKNETAKKSKPEWVLLKCSWNVGLELFRAL